MKTLFSFLIGTIFCLTAISTVAQPTITVDGDLEFCYGDTATLCVEPTYSSLIWNTGATTNCISATESGEYYAVVLDQNSNIDSSLFYNPTTVIVHDPQPTVILWGNGLVCTNQFVTWQWYVNGQPIIGATGPAYTPETPGNYYVLVTDEYGCTGTSVTIDQWMPDGIYEDEIGVSHVFPNPTSDKIRIDFLETIYDVDLNLFNPIGSLIYSRQLDGIQYFDLELPETNGLYFIQLLRSDGTKSTLKVVKK